MQKDDKVIFIIGSFITQYSNMQKQAAFKGWCKENKYKYIKYTVMVN